MPLAVPLNVRAFITVMATPAVPLLRNNIRATVNYGLTGIGKSCNHANNELKKPRFKLARRLL
jgi:hypothetical protein